MLLIASIKEDVSISCITITLEKKEKKVKKSLRLFWCLLSPSLCFPRIQGMRCLRMGNPLCTFCTQVSCIQSIPLRLSLCCKYSRVSWYNNNVIAAVKGFLEYNLVPHQLQTFPISIHNFWILDVCTYLVKWLMFLFQKYSRSQFDLDSASATEIFYCENYWWSIKTKA